MSISHLFFLSLEEVRGHCGSSFHLIKYLHLSSFLYPTMTTTSLKSPSPSSSSSSPSFSHSSSSSSCSSSDRSTTTQTTPATVSSDHLSPQPDVAASHSDCYQLLQYAAHAQKHSIPASSAGNHLLLASNVPMEFLDDCGRRDNRHPVEAIYGSSELSDTTSMTSGSYVMDPKSDIISFGDWSRRHSAIVV